jgi:hypothetical protein
MRRNVVMLVGAAALTVGALISSADAQIERGPAALADGRKTSRRSIEPPAVRIGAGSAARFITGSAAGGVAGAPRAEGVILQRRWPVAASPYPVTSSASRPLSGCPYSPTASTTTA